MDPSGRKQSGHRNGVVLTFVTLYEVMSTASLRELHQALSVDLSSGAAEPDFVLPRLRAIVNQLRHRHESLTVPEPDQP